MFACSYGVAFGAIQQMPQIVPGIDKCARRSKRAAADKPEQEATRTARLVTQETIANYTKAQETGGLAGRFALALLVVHVASRRKLLRVFLVPGLVILPLVFLRLFARRGNRVCEFRHELAAGLPPREHLALGHRHLSGRLLHRRPVQLLGQLPAARVPDAPARHGRKFCRQHRRADVRHAVRRG